MTASPRRVGLVVNVASASGSGRRAAATVGAMLRALGYEITLIKEASAAAARRRLRAVLDADAVDALVLVGGDGLIHSVIQEEPQVPVGIVPTGSGNDFVRALGIPLRRVEAAVRLVHESWDHPRRIDLLEVEHGAGRTRIAGVLSVGYDALVNRIANAIRLPLGPFKYQIALVAAIFRYRPIDVRGSYDGVAISGRKLLFSAAMIPSIGGGIRIVPEASNTQGRLRLFSVDAVPAWRLVLLLPRVINGSHARLPEVTIAAARTLAIEASAGGRPQLGYGDGEHIGFSPFLVRVLPGALRVLS